VGSGRATSVVEAARSPAAASALPQSMPPLARSGTLPREVMASASGERHGY
jgi:hypothetical protein